MQNLTSRMVSFGFVGREDFVPIQAVPDERATSSDIESFFISSVKDIVKVVQNQPYAPRESKITVWFLLYLNFVNICVDRLLGWWLCVQRLCLQQREKTSKRIWN